MVPCWLRAAWGTSLNLGGSLIVGIAQACQGLIIDRRGAPVNAPGSRHLRREDEKTSPKSNGSEAEPPAQPPEDERRDESDGSKDEQ